MEYEEAISQLESLNKEAHVYSGAVDMAIDALRKQIPRPYVINHGYRVCQSCGCWPLQGRCQNCGQVIDWGDKQ